MEPKKDENKSAKVNDFEANQEAMEYLKGMGFADEVARYALQKANNNPEKAANFILEGTVNIEGPPDPMGSIMGDLFPFMTDDEEISAQYQQMQLENNIDSKNKTNQQNEVQKSDSLTQNDTSTKSTTLNNENNTTDKKN